MGKIENTHKRTHFANFYLENFFFFLIEILLLK